MRLEAMNERYMKENFAQRLPYFVSQTELIDRSIFSPTTRQNILTRCTRLPESILSPVS